MNEIEKIFTDLEKYLYKNISSLFGNEQLFNFNSNFPKVNLEEKNNKVYVNVGIPGLTKDHQLKVSIEDNYLVIYGTLKKEKEVKHDNGGEIKESYHEYIYKNIPLPLKVSPQGAKAVYDKGSLRITLNKIWNSDDRNNTINVDFL